MKWFEKSEEQGDSGAQYNLDLLYINGQGVIQSYKEAVKLYIKTAEQGGATSQYNLALMCAKCQGVIKDNIFAHMC